MEFKILFLIFLFHFIDLNVGKIEAIDSNDEKVNEKTGIKLIDFILN